MADRGNAVAARTLSGVRAPVFGDRISRSCRSHSRKDDNRRGNERNSPPHARVCQASDDVVACGAECALAGRHRSRGSIRGCPSVDRGRELRYRTVFLLIATIVVASCAMTTPAPPPAAVSAELQHLIDPRIGWKATPDEAIDRRFDAAWRSILAGDYENARKRLDDILVRDANYAPANLAQAAMELQQGHDEAARTIVDPIAMRYPQYTAAQVYEAEIDVAQNRIRSAYDRYREIIQQPDMPPSVVARYAELQTQVFNQLYAAAVNAPPSDAIHLLRDALEVSPAATAARVLLVQKLIALQQFDEAKRELDPLLNTSVADQPAVQEALAEIDVAHGQYETAIIRYERLARGDTSGKYSRRLEEVKQQFAAANMPPEVLAAMQAPAITRADLGWLVSWNVTSIRFAQNVPSPPIAI